MMTVGLGLDLTWKILHGIGLDLDSINSKFLWTLKDTFNCPWWFDPRVVLEKNVLNSALTSELPIACVLMHYFDFNHQY